MRKIQKIVAIGPESTGKSTICETLSQHYKTLWCPEYARAYLEEHGTNYSFDSLATIAKGQLALEDDFTNKVGATNIPLLFIDTDMYVMKVWCEYVFGKSHNFILDAIASRTYDLYLLCNIDLPWTFDPLREYPDETPRKELYEIYKDVLINQNTPWVEISGSHAQREQQAINAVNQYCFGK